MLKVFQKRKFTFTFFFFFFFFSHPTGAFKRNDSSDLDQIVRKARTRVGARSKRPNRSKSSKLHKSSNSKSRKRRRQYASSSDESDQEDEEDGSEYSSDYDSGYASQKKKLKVEVKVKPGTMELDSQSEAEETPALRPKLSEVIRQQALKRMPTFAPLPISYAREFSSHPIPSTSTSTWTSPNLSSYKSIFESRNTQRQTLEHQASAQKHSKPYFYPNRIYKEQVHAHSEPTFTMKETSINSRYVITSPECSSPSPEYSSPSSSYSAWSQSPVNSRSSFSAYSDEESDLGVAPNSSTSHFENVGLGIDGLDATLFKGDTRDSPSRESSPGPFDLFDTFIV